MQTFKYLMALLSVLLMVALSGCAVISEDQCRAGLWYERGLEDGAAGRGQGMVYRIAQKCQEYGVRIDTESWLRGHEEGVEQFCTPENGYYQGRRGRNYEGVCTGPAADLFMAEYSRGLEVYQIEQDYRRLLDRRDNLESELYSVNATLAETEDETLRRELKHQRRALRRSLRLVEQELFGFHAFDYDFLR